MPQPRLGLAAAANYLSETNCPCKTASGVESRWMDMGGGGLSFNVLLRGKGEFRGVVVRQ